MNRVCSLLAPLALLFAAPACAQPAPAPTPTPTVERDADPALWVVKDADTTIYLFGTIHVLRPGLSWFDDGVKAAFDRADQVVLEMITPDPATMQALVTAKGFAHDGTTLTQKLPEDKRAAFAKALAGFGLPPTALDTMEPWFAATNLSLLPLTRLGYDLTNGPEQTISKAAAAAGKPVIGLETAEQQLGYFDDLSMPAQIAFLSSTVEDLPKVDSTMKEMVDDWARGDPDALAAMINDDLEASPEVKKILLVDRNKRWADWIDRRLEQPGVVFMAVGAGHLAGDQSVLAQLQAHHLTVERVDY